MGLCILTEAGLKTLNPQPPEADLKLKRLLIGKVVLAEGFQLARAVVGREAHDVGFKFQV